MHKIYLFALLITALFFQSCKFKSKEADLIIHNARIYSFDNLDQVHQAMAIKDGRIIAVGAEREILNQHTYKEIFDAKKRVIYPGFIDAHGHFMGLGLSKQQVNLLDAASFQDMVSLTVAAAEKIDFPWVYGWGWNHTAWPDKAFPTKDTFDLLFPNRPVLLRRIDGHSALANQAALDLAGITTSTVINGGEIQVSNGKLTGILVDNAMYKVMEYMPEFTKTQKLKAFKDAEQILFKFGITAVSDMGLKTADILLLDSLSAAEFLTIGLMLQVADNEEDLDYWLNRSPIKSPKFSVTGIKTFMDGALGSRGAALIQPYNDKPEQYGLILKPLEFYLNLAYECKDKGYQLVAHAIGDSANRLALQLFGEVLEKPNDLRWRIEHAQILHPNDINTFRKFTIIPSVQPTHYLSDRAWAKERIGEDRMEYAYLSETLLNQLGMLPFGTDFPIESPNPLRTFTGAVFRAEPEELPLKVEASKETITRKDALKAMTFWPALAAFNEEYRGSLEVGKQADFIMVNIDLLSAKPEEVKTFEVLKTWVAGKSVY
ncbi:MAG: amidohydrolase [Luteibaculaceae bacterium]